MNKTLLILATAAAAIAVAQPASAVRMLNGSGTNGLYPNGASLNGQFVNGQFVNGQFINGSGTNGQFENGAAVTGQKLTITVCDPNVQDPCQVRPGLRIQSIVLPATAGAMDRGGSTKGTGGMNGTSLDGLAKRPEGGPVINGTSLDGFAAR